MVNNLGFVDLEWDSGAPDLKAAFPSIEKQISEYPSIKTELPLVSSPQLNLDNKSPYDSKWQLITSGLSYHIGTGQYTDKETNEKVDFNEINPGVGLERSINDNVSVLLGAYKNSYSDQSVYGMVSLKSDSLISVANYSVRVGVDVGVVSGYEGYLSEGIMVGGGFAAVISPFVNVEISDGGAGIIPKGTNIQANVIPGQGMLGSDNSNALDAVVAISMRTPF